MERKPASWRAARSGVAPAPSSCSPSAFSTVSRPREPRRAASASDSAAGASRAGVVGPGEQGAAAALDVQREAAVDQHHQRPRLASGAVPAALAALGVDPVRPGQRGAVRVGGVGGGQRDRGRLRVGVDLGEGAQPVDRPGGAELGGAEAGHEVAAAAAAGVLERGEHLVGGGEPAGQPLADHGARGSPRRAGRAGARRRRGRGGSGRCRRREQRPAAGGLGRAGARGHPARRRRSARGGGRRLRWAGVPERVSARSGARVSLPTRPAQTRSHSAADRRRRWWSRPRRRAGGRTRRRRGRARRAPPGAARRARRARARAGSAAPGRRGGATPSRRSRAAPRGRPRAPRRSW